MNLEGGPKEPTRKWEKQFLKKLGFHDDQQLRQYLHKLSVFYHALEPHEKRVFLRSVPTTRNALDSLGLDVTEGQLQDFLREREQDSPPALFNAHRINIENDD